MARSLTSYTSDMISSTKEVILLSSRGDFATMNASISLLAEVTREDSFWERGKRIERCERGKRVERCERGKREEIKR